MNIKDFKKISDLLWEIPKSFRKDMRVPARIYSSEKMLRQILKDRSIPQLINGTTLPGIIKYALAMPDCHQGYSVPIGFVGAMRTEDGIISPGACGFDINCGVRLLKSEYEEREIRDYLEKLAIRTQKEVPSGLGKGRSAKIGIKDLDKILEEGAQHLVRRGYGTKEDVDCCESSGKLEWADPDYVSNRAKNRGRDQVGTLGSGNHFLELQKVQKIFDKERAKEFGLFENQVVLMIHCGSRGLGHQVCTDYLKEFIPLMINKYKIKVPDKEFACVPFNSSEGQRYFKAMASAANYAWANRQMISYFVRKAWKDVLGEKKSSLSPLYDVAHNIIKKESHVIDGKKMNAVVHRKGATRAFPPSHPEIPEKYRKTGQPTLLPGTMGTASYIMAGTDQGAEAFFSTSHGAGRKMSRRAAVKAVSGYDIVDKLKEKGIIVRSQSRRGVAEEAPLAYKDVDEVVDVVHCAGLSKKVAKVVPLAVIKGE